MATRPRTETRTEAGTQERFVRAPGVGRAERDVTRAPNLPAGAWRIDAERSTFGFAVRKMGMYHVKGQFRRGEGRIEVSRDGQARAEATIDADSIYTRIPPRDMHLRSHQFLHVDEHPQIGFRADELVELRPGHSHVRGELEIRGVRRPVELHCDVEEAGDGTLRVHMEGTIDRHDFDVRPPQPFEMIVGAEVHLDIDAVAVAER